MVTFSAPVQQTVSVYPEDRLANLECAVREIHWVLIGQFVDPHIFCPASGPLVPDRSASVGLPSSKSRSRRERAKLMKKKLWLQRLAPKPAIHSAVDESCHSPRSNVGDFRSLPQSAWSTLHTLFVSQSEAPFAEALGQSNGDNDSAGHSKPSFGVEYCESNGEQNHGGEDHSKHADKHSEGVSSISFPLVLDLFAQGVKHIEFYSRGRTMVAYTAKNSKVPFDVFEVAPSDLGNLLSEAKQRRVSIVSHLDRVYELGGVPGTSEQASTTQLPHLQESPGHVPNAPCVSDDEDMPEEFSHAQLMYIIDMAVQQSWKSLAPHALERGCSKAIADKVAVDVKHALSCDAQLGSERPTFSRTQVRQLMELISEKVGKAVADQCK